MNTKGFDNEVGCMKYYVTTELSWYEYVLCCFGL